jgi:Rad3-related DNA helicase
LSKILEKQVPEIIEEKEKFEEYDPSKPNDYEKVLEERKKKAEKEILKELSKAEENLEIENEDKSSKESTSISVSG